MEKLLDRAALALSRGFAIGRSPVVPGTIGTLAAVPLYWFLAGWAGWPAYAVSTAALAAVGVWSATVAEEVLGDEDPPSVVIDEVIGFLVAMAGHPPGWRRVLAGFLLFRAFDVVKPPPVRRAERLGGGLGIVADDVVAGLYTNLTLQLGVWLAARFPLT